MNHDIKELINILLVTDELSRFKEDYLVDVFQIWDCYTQDWVPDTPTLLRFETNDVLVQKENNGAFKLVIAPVDTTRSPAVGELYELLDACPCWVRVSSRQPPIRFSQSG